MNTSSNIKSASRYAWVVWIFATLFYAYEFFQRVMVADIVKPLSQAFHTTAASLGIIGSAYYYGYALMQIPAGMLVDKFGTRYCLTIGALLVAIGSFIFGIAPNVTTAALARLLVGIGSSTAFVGGIKLVSVWFPPKRFALIAGLTNFIGYLGGSLAGAPYGWLLNYINWRTATLASAVFGLALAMSIYLIVRNKPKAKRYRGKLHKTSAWQSVKYVAKKKLNWWNGLYTLLIVGPTSAFAALWGTPYFQHVDHLSLQKAAFAITIILLGVAVGSPVNGYISDRLGLRRAPLVVAAFFSMICTSAVLYWTSAPLSILYILSFLFGFFQGAHVANFAIASEINRPAAHGAAIGFTNMATMLGGAILQPLIGLMLNLLWHGHKVHGVAVYLPVTYEYALAIIPITQLLALLVAIFFLRETHCKPYKPGRFKDKQNIGEIYNLS